jgi:hypothetical protein
MDNQNRKRRINMKFCVLALSLFLVAGFAFGADIDGKWAGQYNSGQGDPMQMDFTFKAEGTTLTGTAPGGPGATIPLKDGKIDGNKVSFTVETSMNDMALKFNYKGVLTGDSLELNFEMAGMPAAQGGAPQKFTLKRVK